MTRRLLVIAIRAIGDMVLITPVLRCLKKGLEGAFLSVLSDGASSEVFLNNPHIDRLYRIDRSALHRLPWPVRIRAEWKIISDLRQDRFDTAIDLFGGPRSALLAFLSGASKRYAERLVDPMRRLFYTHPVPVIRDGQHLVEQKFQIVRELIPQPQEMGLELFLTNEEVDSAKQALSKLRGDGPLFGLVPSSGRPVKNWPVERFAEVANRLSRRYSARIVLFGAARDLPVCEMVSSRMAQRPFSVAGTTSLRQAMALLHEMDLVVANNTGLMHIAVALGVPTIALFGMADTVQYRPWGETGVMVTKAPPGSGYWKQVDYEADARDLSLITVEDVLEKAEALLATRDATR